MLNPKQLRSLVVGPALQAIGLWSQPAEDLVMRTGVQEGKLTYLTQIGGGPARGLWQMEQPTFDDLWDRFLGDHPTLADRVRELAFPGFDPFHQLAGNLWLGAAMCRVKYYSTPDPIPSDLEGQARLWKKVYNTPLGAGTPDEFITNCRQAGV